MCGRYALNMSGEEILDKYDAIGNLDFTPNFNIPPTSHIPIIAIGKENTRRLIYARWGLFPNWMEKDPSFGPLFNARSESIKESQYFKSSFMQRRCLIPATGFYEWRKDMGFKTPYYFKRKNGAPLAFAGLWEMKKLVKDDGTSEIMISTTIITTRANSEFEHIHSRFPVLLEKGEWQFWLDPATARPRIDSLLTSPAKGIMDAYPVLEEVNQVANNFEGLTLPLEY